MRFDLRRLGWPGLLLLLATSCQAQAAVHAGVTRVPQAAAIVGASLQPAC